MSAIKDLIQMLVAGNTRRIPFRDVYYQTCHKQIEKWLGKKANAFVDDASFWKLLADATGMRNVIIDVSETEKDAIVADADKSLSNVFNILGSGDVRLNPIKWSSDFIHKYEWKKGTFYRKYNQVDLSNNADVKVPREISRCHHLLRLALAYRFTGEEKYAKTVVDHLEDWIDENPLMYSINWGCAMDVGIRAVNWIWALSLLDKYGAEAKAINKIKISLYQHGWFIYNNLEGNNYSYNNNHYFSDIVGLLHVAMLFRKDKNAAKWLRFAQSTFFRETRLQVLLSGMTFECSTNYSRLVLEMVLTSVVYLKRNGIDVPPDIWSRLESMFDFTMKVTMPDGTMPAVGDQDNGRVLPWGVEELNDERYLLTVGAMLFNRSEMKIVSSGYNVYAAIFAGSRKEYEAIPETKKRIESALLRDAGFALMRRDDNYLLFNVDNQGMYRDTGTTMSHTHCDWFSFVLAAKGIPFIIDPGSYVYSSDAKARNLFRSTKMHNTVVVDGENQEKMPENLLWNYKRDTHPRLISWQSDSGIDLVECEHDGYCWLGDTVTHRRKVEFDKDEALWTITDCVRIGKAHRIAAYFHLDKDVNPTIDGNQIMLFSKGVTLLMTFESFDDIYIDVEDMPISKGYGLKENAKAVVVSIDNVHDSAKLITRLWVKKD